MVFRMRAYTHGGGLGTPTASHHNLFDLEKLPKNPKKVFVVLLTGFEPSTFGSSVQRSNHWANPSPHIHNEKRVPYRMPDHYRLSTNRQVHSVCYLNESNQVEIKEIAGETSAATDALGFQHIIPASICAGRIFHWLISRSLQTKIEFRKMRRGQETIVEDHGWKRLTGNKRHLTKRTDTLKAPTVTEPLQLYTWWFLVVAAQPASVWTITLSSTREWTMGEKAGLLGVSNLLGSRSGKKKSKTEMTARIQENKSKHTWG